MIKNYFTIAWRSLWKNKGYNFLNIFGLAVGIACAGLIFLWVIDELNFDQFNSKKDQLYFVRENQKYDAYTATFVSTPGVLAPAMQSEISGIANTCRMNEDDAAALIGIGDKSMYASGHYVEASIFNMFSFPFIQGNAESVFSQLHSMVITQKTAKKFFGSDKNVIGQIVRVNNRQDYVITGLLKDIPENSSVQFEWLAQFQLWYDASDFAHKWGNNCLSTYVELKPGVDPASINKQLYNFIQKRDPQSIARPFLFSMNDWHLRNEFDNGKQTGGGGIQYVRLFTIIAWIILLIACINFMNLSTARSEKRAKEVGVRKVLGVSKPNLIFQFISEALFLALLSAILAVIIISITLPAFNSLVQKNLSIGLNNPLHLSALVSITILCGLVAGSYPSLYLSSFRPVIVLKGSKLKEGSAVLIRKGLVVFQFSISIILIISTFIIYHQLKHVKSRNLGFNKNNLVQIDVTGEMAKNYNPIKQDLLNTGMVESVALSDHTTLYGGNNTGGLTWDGKISSAQVLISQRYVTPGFFNTTGIKILEGRDITETDSSMVNKTINIVITQSLEKLMGIGALGKTLRYQGDNSGIVAQVVGIVNDYVYGDMYGKPDPVMFFYCKVQNTTKMYVRLKSNAGIEKSLFQIQNVVKKYNPAYPFSYQFVDKQFNQMFLREDLIGNLSKLFASLAIVISCLGLFGLAAYTAERRTKEIGIRKVLGASISGIAGLLSKDFLKLVAVSCIVAFPAAWLLMNNWLQNYQYRIEISWWIFLIAGSIAILIALITVSFQAIKAALANPVKSLRTE